MNRLLFYFLLLFGFLSEVRSQDTTNYTALLKAIPDFPSVPKDSMDQEWAVRNGIIPPITESDAEFELRYFVHGTMYFRGLIIVTRGYQDRFTAERFGFEASKSAPSHWKRIKLLDGFTGPKDIYLWRYHVKHKPKNGWTDYMTGIIESGMFSESPPLNAFIEIKKGSNYKRITPLIAAQGSKKKLLFAPQILNDPLESEEAPQSKKSM